MFFGSAPLITDFSLSEESEILMPTLFRKLDNSCWNNKPLKKDAIFKRTYYCEVKEKPEQVSFIEPRLSVACLHKMIESTRLAFFDGVKYISDPQQERIPLNQLLSKEYAASRRNSIQSDRCVWNQFAIICFYQLTSFWFMGNILYTLIAIRE